MPSDTLKVSNAPLSDFVALHWGGAAGTWFWIDPVNDLAFIGMIQMQGGNRPDGMNFRADSAKLVYAALSPSAAKTSGSIQ